MDIIEGKHAGTKIYVYDNYTYTVDKRFPHIYRCSKRRTMKCSGRIKEQEEQYILKCPHNHPEDPCVVQASNMKREMIRLCQETTKPLKEIFDTVCRTDLEAATYISYNNLKSTLSHYRALSRPIIPHNLHNLRELLENYEPTRSIYKGYAVSADNKIVIIFSTDTLLQMLSESKEIYVDGTFSIVPKKPHIAQLYSVHVRYASTGIATLFALCEVRSASLYKAMWDKIVELAPGLEQNLKFIMSDYERAAMSALNQRFPTASLHGCWFHYSQALLRKWRKLQLNSAPRELLSMAMSMALAPSNLFHKSLNIMQTIADNVCTTHPNILLFMAYLRTTWLPISSKVSVYECPARTNNLVESFHHIANQKIGTRNPALWIFLDHLAQIISNQELDYRRLQNNVRPRRPSTRFTNQRNAQIVEGQNSLMNGSISLKQFLRMFYRFTQQCEQSEVLQDIADDEIDGSLLSDESFNIPIHNQSNQRSHTRRINRRENFQNNQSSDDAEKNETHLGLNCLDALNSTVMSVQEESAKIEENNNENLEIENNNNIQNLEMEKDNDNNQYSEIEENNEIINDRIANNSEIEENNAENSINDEEIYRIPEDDYGILEESTTSSEVTFHEIQNMQAIIENNKEPRPEGHCIICITEKSCIVFIPCGHTCVCATCINNFLHKKCPLCNLSYENYIKIIIP